MKPIILISLVLLAFACEYEPPEKVTYIEPDNSPPTFSNETLDLNTDTLYIWSPTRFCFDLRSSNQSIEGIAVEYLGKTITFEGFGGYIDFDPTNLQEGAYKITLNVYTHSGRGSLADVTGYEFYHFTKEWTLIYEKVTSLKVKFTNATIENGNLVVHWQKFKRPYFNSYKITATDSALNYSFSKTINTADSSFLIDPSFVGGSVKFSLKVSLNNWDGTTADFVSDNFTYKFPVKVTFDERSDSMTIHWTNIPFNHKVYFNSTMLDIGSAKSYTISSPGLGYLLSYQLSVKPLVKLTWDNQMYYIYSHYTIGTLTDMKFSGIEYIPEINAFFLKYQMFFRKYEGTSLGRLQSYDYSYDYYGESTIALSPDKTQAFTTVNQNIAQFNSSTFELISKKRFGPSSSGNYYFDKIKILNDSMMYVAYDCIKYNFVIYNFKSRQVIDSAELSKIDGDPYNLAISKDGKYVANCSSSKLKVFRNTDNTKLEQIFETTGSFLECIFDPVNTNNLLIQTTTNSYVIRCPDMETIAVIPDSIKGMAVNFDPVTNYLLYVSYNYKTMTVYDYEHNIIKYKGNHHGYFKDFYLANNIVFQKDGYNLNISSYVK